MHTFTPLLEPGHVTTMLFSSRTQIVYTVTVSDIALPLPPPPPPPTVVVRDPTGVCRLNFARLVMGYARRLALTDPREALQYFFLLKVERVQLM